MWYDHTEARREMFEDPDDGHEFSRRQLLDAQREADAEEMERQEMIDDDVPEDTECLDTSFHDHKIDID